VSGEVRVGYVTRLAAWRPQLPLPQRGPLHVNLSRQRLDRLDARPAIVPLHVSPLLPLREIIDPAGCVTDPERPLLQAKQRQEQHRVGVDGVEAQHVGMARNQPARCRPALDVRAAVVEVLVRPDFEKQVAGPPALRLDLDAGHVARAGGDEQIAEAALKVLRQRTLGDSDDLPASSVGFEEGEQHCHATLLHKARIGVGVHGARLVLAAGAPRASGAGSGGT